MRTLMLRVRQQAAYFLAGFVIAFIIYLLIRYDFDDIILGAVIGVGGGIAVLVVANMLNKRFPDEPKPPVAR